MKYDKITVYKAADGWRWRYVSSNGRTLADGGQGYSRRIDAMKGAAHVCGYGLLGKGLTRYGQPVDDGAAYPSLQGRCRMTAQPTWSPTDDGTADLLSVLADDGSVSPSKDEEWFGPFYRRACLEGLIAPTGGWDVSTDTAGRNAGRPVREYRWLLTAAQRGQR